MSGRRDLSPADAVWLYSEWENNHQTVSAFLWTDRRIDPDEFREVVRTRLVDRFRVFRQRAVMSRNPLLMPHWEDDPDFDLENHVEVVRLEAPGDKAALERLVGEQRSLLLDRDHPLWKLYLIQGFDGDTSAVHARIQHAIADGQTLVRLFLSLADESTDGEETAGKQAPDAAAVRSAPTEASATGDSEGRRARGFIPQSPLQFRRRARAAGGAVAGSIGGAVQSLPARIASTQDALEQTLDLALDPSRFVEFGSEVTDTMRDQVEEAATGAFEAASGVAGKVSETTTALRENARLARYGVRDGVAFTFPPRPGKTILHGKVGGTKLVTWMEPMPMAPVKAAGKAFGATINDALLGCLTHALRRYLLEKEALSADELFTAVPVSLRKPDEPLPENLGNRFGLVPVLLPVHEEDRVEQVLEIKRQVDRIKAGMMPVVSFGLTGFSALTTPDVERLIHKLNQAHSIGVTTNVPGPRGETTIAGAKVLGMWGMGGVSGHMNLSFGIFTLDGELNFSVHSDAAITEDPKRIEELFVESVLELQEVAGVA